MHYTVIRIGFELPDYTYTEPQSEDPVAIDEFYVSPSGQPENGPIYLIKQDNVTSEQSFLLTYIFITLGPGPVHGQDFCFGESCQETENNSTLPEIFFDASQQRIPFRLTVLPDTLPEGVEQFLAFLNLPATSGDFSYTTTVTILDNDRMFRAHCIFYHHVVMLLLHF